MSSPSSLELDFLGLSLVDTPPSTKHAVDRRQNRLFANLTNTSDEEKNDLTVHKFSASNENHLNHDDLGQSREKSISAECDYSELQIESEPDPIWNYDPDKKSFVLNHKCSTYDTNIQWPSITLSKEIHGKLYAHQKIGVRWLASLHHRMEQYGIGGGILGDDMVRSCFTTIYMLKIVDSYFSMGSKGLGKTMQTLAFIGGLFRCHTIRNALVICPVSVLQNWKNEAEHIFELSGISSKVSVIVVDSNSRKGQRASLLNFAMVW
jgi:SNF2 family DNA or RNA helicase